MLSPQSSPICAVDQGFLVGSGVNDGGSVGGGGVTRGVGVGGVALGAGVGSGVGLGDADGDCVRTMRIVALGDVDGDADGDTEGEADPPAPPKRAVPPSNALTTTIVARLPAIAASTRSM
jgi:hypothetical protein